MVIALNAIADGTAMVTENVFEARFIFVNELTRLGADVRTDGHHAVVRGVPRLSGAPVRATDIRAGAGLVLAGLVAEGDDLRQRRLPRRPWLPRLRRAAAVSRRRRHAGARPRRGVRRLASRQDRASSGAGRGLVLAEAPSAADRRWW